MDHIEIGHAHSDDDERCPLCRVIAALECVIFDVHEYERVNNLAPNPGRTECWDSVAHATDVLRSVIVPFAPDLDHRPHPHGEPNKPHDRRYGK